MRLAELLRLAGQHMELSLEPFPRHDGVEHRSARGQGAAYARGFAAEGASVALVDDEDA